MGRQKCKNAVREPARILATGRVNPDGGWVSCSSRFIAHSGVTERAVIPQDVAVVPELLDEGDGIAHARFEFAFSHFAYSASDISPAASANVRVTASASDA